MLAPNPASILNQKSPSGGIPFLRFRLTESCSNEQQGTSTMPAKSKAQQKAAGAALAAKRGDQKVSDLKGASRSMYQSMTEEELDELASTKRKGKPEHVR
jgi:hypothetical protein